MAGLLDVLNSDQGRMALGLLAAAGPRSDGAGFGQRLQEGMGSFDAYKQNALKQKMLEAQMQQAMEHAAQQKAERARQQTIQQGMAQYFKPGQQALSPLTGSPELGILPSAGRAAVAPSFDAAGAAQFLAEQGEFENALKLLPKPKELQVNKLDVKDFTPESVQKFAQTGSYADLVRMDKAHFGDSGGQLLALDPFTGKPLNSINKTQSPDSRASNAVSWANNAVSRQRLEFDKQGGAAAFRPIKQGPMSVTLQKELLESDDAVQAGNAIVSTLENALKVNKDAYSGYAAKGRAVLASNVLPWQTPGADKTIDLDNMMTGQALESLKTVFGGMPTEGERKILLEMQASADKTPTQREAIMTRAIAAAKRRAAYAQQKAKAIRSGDYLTNGVPSAPTPSGSILDQADAILNGGG